MRQKKDIGQLFENKLNNGKKTPSKSIWEKINTSLDAEKRRKKRVFYYWLVGSGITILLGLLLVNTENITQNNIINKNNTPPFTKQPIKTTAKENNENSVIVSKEKSVHIDSENNKKLSKIVNSNENTKQSEQKKSTNSKTQKQHIEARNKTNKHSQTTKGENENYTVSKNYYYYNSKDGKQLVTTSKREIDSLIAEGHKSVDSLRTKNNDTIKD
jgi:hypothetical protein